MLSVCDLITKNSDLTTIFTIINVESYKSLFRGTVREFLDNEYENVSEIIDLKVDNWYIDDENEIAVWVC